MVRTVNRVLLGLIGAGLFALGAAVLLGGLDLQRRWDFEVPTWWPFRGPRDVVIGAEGRTRFQDDWWWWPVVIAVLSLLLILLLWWLLSQLRRHHLAVTLVDSDDGESARLLGSALETALSAEAEATDGIAQSHVRLTGRPTRPVARVNLELEAHAEPAKAVQQLSRQALRHARESASLSSLPATVCLRTVRHRAHRVA
ncbi:alkaline shock response membrane anchor protein AmaP [Streptomyces adustus]|uniref:Alkaline shock response membrane anchor protein AmaP n=1 Tax=Streptomyces adustus TaxID=1609272 RepID=A0A5N8VB20_9ACTN|nr:alkaline shock response membrane anchor protein AmaP [Streptomyces adustus]MPY32407.1 alkaline shock response membrane anchor protein AmaP [Streptomyces adustus]